MNRDKFYSDLGEYPGTGGWYDGMMAADPRQNMLLTDQVSGEVTATWANDAYWLGWIKAENIPQALCQTHFKCTKEDDYVTFENLTWDNPKIYNIGYYGMAHPGPNLYDPLHNVSYNFRAGGPRWQLVPNYNYVDSFTNPGDTTSTAGALMNTFYPQKGGVNAAVSTLTFTIYVHGKYGNDPSSLTNYFSARSGFSGKNFFNSAKDLVDWCAGKKPFSFSVSVAGKSLDITFAPNDEPWQLYTDNIDGVYFSFYVGVSYYGFYSGQYGSSTYNSLTSPMIEAYYSPTMEDGYQNVDFVKIGDRGSVYDHDHFDMARETDGTFYMNQAFSGGVEFHAGNNDNGHFVGGAYGQFSKSQILGLGTTQYNFLISGNILMCYLLTASSQAKVYRFYVGNTASDLSKHLALMPRIYYFKSDTDRGYYDGLDSTTYISYVTDKNEFTATLLNGTQEELGNKLRDWQKEGCSIDMNTYLAEDKPEIGNLEIDDINLWSYKRSNTEPAIANTFPYLGGDAGDGDFISAVRSSLKIKNIDRINDSINADFEIHLDDVIRKSAGQKKHMIGYLEGSFNSSSTEDIHTVYNLYIREDEDPQILDKQIKSGFYQGEVCSYISTSNPGFTIIVKKNWIGAPIGIDEYKSTIICENTKTGEIMEQEVSNMGTGLVRFSGLKAYDEDDNLINYIIYEEQPEDFPWESKVINGEINYESELKTATIENKWNRIDSITKETIITRIFVNDYEAARAAGLKNIESIYPHSFSEAGEAEKKSKEQIVGDDTGVDRFFEFLESDDVEFNGKGVWVEIVKNSSEYAALKNNSSALFCAKFIWHQYFKDDGEYNFVSWHEITPFFTIVVKDSEGEAQFYHFSIELDDDGGSGLNEIPYPYVSSRVGDSKGAESTALQWKRGAKISRLDPNAPAPAPVLNTNAWINQSAFNEEWTYSAQPTKEAGPAPFTYTAGNIAYSSISIIASVDQVKLRNFCIYLADRNCLDSSHPQDLVGYYYKMYLKEPIGENNYGVIGMQIHLVSKTQGFYSGVVKNQNGQDYNYNGVPYRYHLWEIDEEKCPYYGGDAENSLRINFSKLNEDLEAPTGLFYDFIYAEDNYKSIFREEEDN